jgi:hypothetical protein
MFRNAIRRSLGHDSCRKQGRFDMLDSIRNLRTSEIELRQRLPRLECDWLVGALRARRGIAGAKCAPDALHLTVDYDADRLASDDVVDFLNECGVLVSRVHGGYA